jgi:hypothetical protein
MMFLHLNLKPKAGLILIAHNQFDQLGNETFNGWMRAANTIEAKIELANAPPGRTVDPFLPMNLTVHAH